MNYATLNPTAAVSVDTAMPFLCLMCMHPLLAQPVCPIVKVNVAPEQKGLPTPDLYAYIHWETKPRCPAIVPFCD